MRPVSFDLETHLVQPGLLAPPIVCGTAAAPDSDPVILLRDDALDLLRELLEDPDVEIVVANGAYDFGCACAARPELLPLVFQAHADGRVFDVLIAQALLDIHDGILFKDPTQNYREIGAYSLAFCEKRHLGIDRTIDKKGPDTWRSRYALLDGVPLDQWPAEAVRYPLDDATGTLAVALRQKAIGYNLHAQAEQARAAWALHLSAMWGMRTDPDLVPHVVDEIGRKHVETLERFKACGIIRADGSENQSELRRRVAVAYGASAPCPTCAGSGKVRSTKTKDLIQCKACGATGLDINAAQVPRSKAGGVKADRDVLANSGDETLEAYAEAGVNETLFNAFSGVLVKGLTAPINPRTNVLVNTGRSSYKGDLRQNFPRKGKIRDCFVPRPRWLYVSVDYSTLELCTLAQTNIWLQGSSRMADAINEGRDLHLDFGGDFIGISYDEAKARRKAGDKQILDLRQMAKAGNFGLPGGLGAAALVDYARKSYNAHLCLLAGVADKCGVDKVQDRSGKLVCAACVKVAQEMKSKWLRRWEEMPGYFEIVTSWTEGAMGGSVQVLGPGEDLGLIRGQCSFTSGANLPFQGLAARGAKAALFNVSREAYCVRKSPLYGVRSVIFIHDEILAEIPITDHTHEAAERLAEIMIETMRYFTPDVRIAAEPALMVRWLKGAETERDEHGRLLPSASCPKCGKITAVNWDGTTRAHKTPKKDDGTGGVPCAEGVALCRTDLRTLGLLT